MFNKLGSCVQMFFCAVFQVWRGRIMLLLLVFWGSEKAGSEDKMGKVSKNVLVKFLFYTSHRVVLFCDI